MVMSLSFFTNLGWRAPKHDFVHDRICIKGLVIESLRSEDFKKAADLMNEFKLDYEDSLHLAVALRVGAQEIISNDKDFDATQIKRTI